MSKISNDTMKKIVDAFRKRGVSLKCPRCGQNKMAIIEEGYLANVIQPTDLSQIAIQGDNIPTIGTVCENCGFVAQHSLVILGLLPEQEETKG